MLQIVIFMKTILIFRKYIVKTLCNFHGIGAKLGTEDVLYQKLANFIQKKDIHVNTLESAIFEMTA